MARHRAEKPEDDLDDLDTDEEMDGGAAEDTDTSADRPAEVEKFWEKVRVDPIEIALPRGVGYTLRAYRMSDIVATDEQGADETQADETQAEQTQAEEAPRPTAAGKASAAKSSVRNRVDEDAEDDEDQDRDDELDEDLDDERDDDDVDDVEDEAEDDEAGEKAAPEPEEVPVFLTQDRRLLLFRTPEGLAKFVRSGETNNLQVIDEWETLRSDLTTDQVVATDDDRYELDLVVENLRGGHDAWDAELIIKAGEVCRDLGHTLRIESVVTALSPGSPLDDLDEALRATEAGRLGGFFARRKLRRIGAQQAALAWRSIIGKISTSVDWRD